MPYGNEQVGYTTGLSTPPPDVDFVNVPGPHVFAHNDIWVTADSPYRETPNFQYILEVYANSILIARLQSRPNPDYGLKGIFNIRSVAQSHITSNYFFPSDGATPQPILPYVEFELHLGQSGLDASGNVTGSTGVETTGVTAWNGAHSIVDASVYSMNQRMNNFATSRRVLSATVGENENFYQTIFYEPPTGLGGFVRVLFKDAAGVSVAQTDFDITGSCIMNIGKPALFSSTSWHPDTSYWEVYVYRNTETTPTLTAGPFTVTVQCKEPRYQTRSLHFLNRWGGIETVQFRLVSRRSMEANRIMMHQPDGNWNGSTFKNIATNRVFYEGSRPVLVTYKERVKVMTDYLTDRDYVLYSELVTSPMIYMEEYVTNSPFTFEFQIPFGGGTFYVPVLVKDTAYEYKQKLVDKMTTLGLELEYAFSNATQLR